MIRNKRRYNDIFNKLEYKNKVVLNEIADYLNPKKLNRLANKEILTKIADMVLDCQNRAVPLEDLFGRDRAAFCDKLSENAPAARTSEKILAFLRNISALFLFVSVIAVFVSIISRSSIYLNGLLALQIIGGTLLVLFFFPLVCYHDALFGPLKQAVPVTTNVIEPYSARISIQSLLLRVLYSLVCAAGAIVYVVYFWIYPDILARSSLNNITINVLVCVLVSAVVFISSFVAEKQVVSRNYHQEM